MVIKARVGGRIQSLWDTCLMSAMVNKTVNKHHLTRPYDWRVDLRVRRSSGGHLGTSPGSGLGGRFWVHSEVNSGSILRSILTLF